MKTRPWLNQTAGVIVASGTRGASSARLEREHLSRNESAGHRERASRGRRVCGVMAFRCDSLSTKKG